MGGPRRRARRRRPQVRPAGRDPAGQGATRHACVTRRAGSRPLVTDRHRLRSSRTPETPAGALARVGVRVVSPPPRTRPASRRSFRSFRSLTHRHVAGRSPSRACVPGDPSREATRRAARPRERTRPVVCSLACRSSRSRGNEHRRRATSQRQAQPPRPAQIPPARLGNRVPEASCARRRAPCPPLRMPPRAAPPSPATSRAARQPQARAYGAPARPGRRGSRRRRRRPRDEPPKGRSCPLAGRGLRARPRPARAPGKALTR